MKSALWFSVLGLTCIVPFGGAAAEGNRSPREEELWSVEQDFARTLADRDLEAFATYLAEDVVFFNGNIALRGRNAVVEAWAPFFTGEAAPFSWGPEVVAVTARGDWGLTSGPVYDPEGQRVTTFNSVWRRVQPGRWEIVFDRGCPQAECP